MNTIFESVQILRTAMVVSILAVFPQWVTASDQPPMRTISGTDEALEVLKNLKNGEIADMPISGTFVYETEYFESYSEPSITPSGVHFEEKDPGKLSRSIDFAVQGNKIRFSKYVKDENGAKVGQGFIASWDGQKGVMYKPDRQYANIFAERNSFDRDYNTSDPRGFSLFDKTIGASVDIEGGEFSIERAPVENSEIRILVQKSEYRTLKYWLKSGDKGNCIPTKIAVYFKGKDKIESETLIHDFTQTDDGSWFITKSTTTFPDQNMEYRFVTKKVEFEAIPDPFFTIELPDNTLVDDIASDMRFITGGDVPRSPDVDAIILDSIAKSPLSPAPPEETKDMQNEAVRSATDRPLPADTKEPFESLATDSINIAKTNIALIIFLAFTITLLMCLGGAILVKNKLKKNKS